MEITEIIKESFLFPANNLKQLALYIVITIVAGAFAVGGLLSSVFADGFSAYAIIAFILAIISLIIAFILAGYQISIIKSGIEHDEEVPDFDWQNDLITGIKSVILNIVYFIIPAIIVLIVGVVTGLPSAIGDIGKYVIENSTNATVIANSTSAAATIPDTLISNFVGSLTITAVVAIILFIIFAFAQTIGQARLANTGSLKEGINIPEAFKDISRIGVGKVIATVILMIIVVFVVAAIFGLIAYYVPVLGILSIIIDPYLMFFSYRVTGNLYSDIA